MVRPTDLSRLEEGLPTDVSLTPEDFAANPELAEIFGVTDTNTNLNLNLESDQHFEAVQTQNEINLDNFDNFRLPDDFDNFRLPDDFDSLVYLNLQRIIDSIIEGNFSEIVFNPVINFMSSVINIILSIFT
jgi:uncharacterized protein YpuA (DUF1002 family)